MKADVRTLRTSGTIETVIRFDRAQVLTDEQRQQALANIGLTDQSQIDADLTQIRADLAELDSRVSDIKPVLRVSNTAALGAAASLLTQNCVIYVDDASNGSDVGAGAAAYIAFVSVGHVDLVKIYEAESMHDEAPDFTLYYSLAK